MRGMKRAKRDRWIMGVCGGIAHRYGWSSTAVRIATIYRGDHHPRVQCDPDPSGLLSARLSAPRDRRVLAYTQEVGRGAAPLPLFTSYLEGVFSRNMACVKELRRQKHLLVLQNLSALQTVGI